MMGTQDVGGAGHEDADGKLSRVHPDLGSDLLFEILRRGQEALDHTTANHPVTAPGWYRWSEATRATRDLLAPHDWTSENKKGVELTVSPDGAVAFYVAGGNCDTGREHRVPSTENPRGKGALKQVYDPNQTRLGLVGDEDTVQGSRRPVWILLHRYCEEPDREFFRLEFSLPFKTNKKGRIIGWARRIILPELELTHAALTGDLDESEGEGIEIDIRRRGA